MTGGFLRVRVCLWDTSSVPSRTLLGWLGWPSLPWQARMRPGNLGRPCKRPCDPWCSSALHLCNPWMCISTNTRTYTRPRTHHDNVRDQYQCSCTARAHAPGIRDYLLVACPSHLLSCLGTRRWMYPMLARILSSGSITGPATLSRTLSSGGGLGG